MSLLGQCWRTLFNLLPLRGRKRRLAKLFVILLLSACVFLFGMTGVCMLDSKMCTETGGERSLQRTRDRFEGPEDYEVKQNAGPFRNIKGDQRPDPSRKFEAPKENFDEQRTQVQLPPIDDDAVMSRDGQVMEKGVDGMAADGGGKIMKSDTRATTGTESENDISLDDDDDESEDPIHSQKRNTEKEKRAEATNTIDEVQPLIGASKDDSITSDVARPAGKARAVVQQQTEQQHEEMVVHDAGREEGRKAVAANGLEVGNQLQMSQAKKRVILTKNTNTSDAAPNGEVRRALSVDSNTKKVQVRPVPKVKLVEKLPANSDSSNVAQPSLHPPPGVVQERAIVNDHSNDDRQQSNGGGNDNGNGGGGGGGGDVQTIPKGSLLAQGGGEGGGGGGRGGGGGGDEEEKQMSAAEMAEAIESGEMCKTVCPPFTWSEWSPCSKACGKGRQYRKALYKFICQSSELCPLNRIEESVCETPCKFDPEKYGGPNGLDMYPINPLNPAIYPEDKKYMCGHWLVEYETLHRDILSGKRPPSYLVYSTGKGTYPTAGGIAPRLRGITTAFFLAVLLERAFMIEWQDPPGLDQYLEPKSFNWADLSKLDKLKRGPVRDIGSWRSAKESSISSQWYMSTNFSTYFTNEVEVLQGHRYDFTYAVLRNPELMPKAFELGVDRIKCRICCAFHMLFRMTEKFQQQMDALLGSLGAPLKTIGAIQVRTKSHSVQEAVKYVDSFVKCAIKAGKGLKMSSQISWVPIFNNRLVVHIVHKKYGDKLKIPINIDTATRTVHTHLGNLPPDTELEVAKAVQERTFKEFFLTINSTILIRKKGYEGSFGNIADAIRRFYHKLGTVHTFLVGNTCTKFPDTFKIE